MDHDSIIKNFTNKPIEVFRQVIPVHADAMIWVAVVGACNLAMRHPQAFAGESAKVLQEFSDTLMKRLRDCGVYTEEEFQFAWKEQEPYRKR